VHFMRNAMAHAGKTQRRIVSAWIGTAFAQDDAEAARKQWRQVADQARPRVAKLAALMDEQPLLLIAPHGTAKSELLNRLAAALGLEHRHYNASLIAFDDLPYASLFDPGLTVIDQDAEAMGRLAGEGLIAVIGGERPASVVLPTRLVVRGSCRAPALARKSPIQATERSQGIPAPHTGRQDHL